MYDICLLVKVLSPTRNSRGGWLYAVMLSIKSICLFVYLPDCHVKRIHKNMIF